MHWDAPLPHPIVLKNQAAQATTLREGAELVMARCGKMKHRRSIELAICDLAQAATSGSSDDIALATRHLKDFLRKRRLM